MDTVFQRTFDMAAGQAAGDQGMALAAMRREDALDFARSVAIQIARGKADRRVTADEVQARLEALGVPPTVLGNAAGSLFRRQPVWRFTGEWKHSSRVSAHGRSIRVWLYIGE